MRFSTRLCILITTIFLTLTTLAAQSERPRKVRVIGSKQAPKPARLIEARRKTKRTILLPKSILTTDKKAVSDFELQTFSLVNAERRKEGAAVLVLDERLSELARFHSEEMAQKGYFSHIDARGMTVDRRALTIGITNWSAIGENIAFNQGIENPVSFTIKRWLLSRGHMQNMLDTRWRKTGIGVAVTKDGKHFFTQVFAR